jgi:hypothetical protein
MCCHRPAGGRTLAALINGSWLMRHLGRLNDRAVVMHGHRHIGPVRALGVRELGHDDCCGTAIFALN